MAKSPAGWRERERESVSLGVADRMTGGRVEIGRAHV